MSETKKILSRSEFRNALLCYGVQMQALSQCPTSKDIRDEAERLLSQLLDHDQDQRDRIAELAHRCNLGGNPLIVGGIHRTCTADPKDHHLIYGPGFSNEDKTEWMCELHGNRARITALEADRDESRDTHAASMATWLSNHTQQFMEIGELNRQIDEWAKTAETLRHERDEARAASQQNYDNWQESRAYHFSATEELAALRLRLEEAGKDTALLDWREANPNHSFGRYADGEWTDGRGGSHKTYRAALEAAKETA